MMSTRMGGVAPPKMLKIYKKMNMERSESVRRVELTGKQQETEKDQYSGAGEYMGVVLR